MTYQQVKDMVLKLLNQYTIAGNRVAVDYNNQQDYLVKIPALVNDAMLEISTTVRKLPATLRLSELPGEDLGEQLQYELPEDFFQFKSGDVLRTEDGRILHARQYMRYGKKFLVVPKEETGDYIITYYRYPHLLPEEPACTTELDNDPDVHYAIPYYVAAMLVAVDEPFLCALYNNKYEDKLSKMLPDISAEITTVQDAYSF